MHTYVLKYTSSHRSPFRAAVSHRSGQNTVHQPTQPTNYYAIISLARRRTTLPTYLPARNALFLLEKGKQKTIIGDQQPGSSGSRGEKEKKNPILNALRTPDTYILRCNACIAPDAYPQPPHPTPTHNHILTYTQQTLSRKREFPPCFSFFPPTAPLQEYHLQTDFGSDFHAFFALPPFPFTCFATNGQDELEEGCVYQVYEHFQPHSVSPSRAAGR